MKYIFGVFLSLFIVPFAAAQMPKFCTTGNRTKCNAAGVNFTCVPPTKDGCEKDVANKKAHFTLASADEMSENGEELKIVMGQKLENLDDFVRYYGLAFVKKGTKFNLKQLKGKKSCHTGVGRTAGWKIPVGYLLYTKQMTWKTDQYQSAADFFGDSCAPGIREINTTDAVKTDFCKLCNSTCTKDDGFDGHEGAFKCMAEGNNDRVGFLKQSSESIPQAVFNKTGKTYGSEADYQLLCKDGSKRGLDDFKTCNIAVRPAAALVTSINTPEATIKEYRDVLEAAGVTKLKNGGFVSGECEALKEFKGTAKKYVGDYGLYYNALSARCPCHHDRRGNTDNNVRRCPCCGRMNGTDNNARRCPCCGRMNGTDKNVRRCPCCGRNNGTDKKDTGAATYTIVSLALHFAVIFALLPLI